MEKTMFYFTTSPKGYSTLGQIFHRWFRSPWKILDQKWNFKLKRKICLENFYVRKATENYHERISPYDPRCICGRGDLGQPTLRILYAVYSLYKYIKYLIQKHFLSKLLNYKRKGLSYLLIIVFVMFAEGKSFTHLETNSNNTKIRIFK